MPWLAQSQACGLYAILTQKQRERFEEEWELDFAYAVPGKARFRVNIYRQRDALARAVTIPVNAAAAAGDCGADTGKLKIRAAGSPCVTREPAAQRSAPP